MDSLLINLTCLTELTQISERCKVKHKNDCNTKQWHLQANKKTEMPSELSWCYKWLSPALAYIQANQKGPLTYIIIWPYLMETF